MQNLISHAQKHRYDKSSLEETKDDIQMTEEWFEELNELPFKGSKQFQLLCYNYIKIADFGLAPTIDI